MPTNQPSRRKFLQTSGIAGLLTAFMPASLLAGEAVEDPVANKPLVFLFQGDSITDGNRGRNDDLNHIMGHGYAYSIASRVGADFPQQHFQFINRGVSGNRIPDLQQRWQVDTLDLRPDVLSVLVGINDVNAAVDGKPDAQTVTEFETGYRALLQACKAANPSAWFVLGIPFVAEGSRSKNALDKWKEGTRQRAAVVRALALEFNAVLVDYPSLFEQAFRKAPVEYWIWDGIHPTVYGHELMARAWIKQVAQRLPLLKKYHY